MAKRSLRTYKIWDSAKELIWDFYSWNKCKNFNLYISFLIHTTKGRLILSQSIKLIYEEKVGYKDWWIPPKQERGGYKYYLVDVLEKHR